MPLGYVQVQSERELSSFPFKSASLPIYREENSEQEEYILGLEQHPSEKLHRHCYFSPAFLKNLM